MEKTLTLNNGLKVSYQISEALQYDITQKLLEFYSNHNIAIKEDIWEEFPCSEPTYLLETFLEMLQFKILGDGE